MEGLDKIRANQERLALTGPTQAKRRLEWPTFARPNQRTQKVTRFENKSHLAKNGRDGAPGSQICDYQ